MKLLLDTQALLWMVADDPRLGETPRSLLQSADELFWSIASLWEIGIKLSLDRPDFRLGPNWARLIPEEMQRNGIRRLDLEPAHCDEVARLPWHHRDTFDRLLVAQARCETLAILSSDAKLGLYKVQRAWS